MGGETVEIAEICYCLEMFRKKDPDVKGECLKMQCGRYKIEKRRENGNLGTSSSVKEILRRKKMNRQIGNEQ